MGGLILEPEEGTGDPGNCEGWGGGGAAWVRKGEVRGGLAAAVSKWAL